jgi:hypothetical protein
MKIIPLLFFFGIMVLLSSCSKGRTQGEVGFEYEHEDDWSETNDKKTAVS